LRIVSLNPECLNSSHWDKQREYQKLLVAVLSVPCTVFVG
jgi:hypothetical protein